MALSTKARKRLEVAMARRAEAKEVADAIDAGGNLEPAANVAALAGTLTGTVDGTMVDVAATAASTAGGAEPSAAQVDAGIATAVASIVTGVNTQNKELLTKVNAVIAALVAAGLMDAP